ncbi:MAG: intracellular protease, PfpI family [Phycisphaerales bacterium]|nr:intracellular protease, PfpI family [Phycisphaerales bacterium]
MADRLSGKKVAILVADGFEHVEMTEPRKALEDAGAGVDLISPNPDRVRSWKMTEWGDYFDVDTPLDQANPDDYDAIHLPGGVINPDKLRTIPQAVEFVKAFFRAGKPVASICHGPWMLIEAEAVEGRTVTSWPSLRTDLKNAGANWVDQEVVVDGGMVTSRKPDDIPAYNSKMIEEFAEGVHAQQQVAAHA